MPDNTKQFQSEIIRENTEKSERFLEECDQFRKNSRESERI